MILMIKGSYYNDLIFLKKIKCRTDIGNDPRHVNDINYSNKSIAALKDFLKE